MLSRSVPRTQFTRHLSCVGGTALSQVTHWSKYARHNQEAQRREDWRETVQRSENMFLAHFPELSDRIEWAFDKVYKRQVLPSMRCMQFAGRAVEANHLRMYNCSYTAMESPEEFRQIMYLLLSGAGVGYSVQFEHVAKLPPVLPSRTFGIHVVEDTIEGWAMAVDALVKSYLGNQPRPLFDYSQIRAEGTPLVTSGGYAPGHEGLKASLENAQRIFDSIPPGRKLRPIDVHDIVCHLSAAVMSGGVRRSSLISLFSSNDSAMLEAKSGKAWFTEQPQRRFSNNSAVVYRQAGNFESTFKNLWDVMCESGSGEPGILQSNTLDMGVNPCGEKSLRKWGLCNLTEINATDIRTQSEFESRARAASFIGTLQASFTGFNPIMGEGWRETAEKEALIGVGMTGIAAGGVGRLNLAQGAQAVLDENETVAHMIGIQPAARATTIKPSGTTSIVLGCTSSGIHAWHAPYFIRRINVKKSDPLYAYAMERIPDFTKDSIYDNSGGSAVLEFPIIAPQGHDTLYRWSESATEFLDRVARFNTEWVWQGHRRGENKNNTSATLSMKEEEQSQVFNWMVDNRDKYNAMTILPYDGHNYAQTPFEEISSSQYYTLSSLFEKQVRDFDLREIVEHVDMTNPLGESACSGDKCEIKF